MAAFSLGMISLAIAAVPAEAQIALECDPCDPKEDPDLYVIWTDVGQIILAVLAVLISYLYNYSHGEIMAAKWRSAW